MKKVLIIMLAIMFMASMVYAAEDRLSLSGQMRAWALSLNNYQDFNDDNDADAESFFSQRFRLGAKITASEGVYGHLRFDFTEDTWGSDNFAGVRYNETTELQVDRAYLEVDKAKYNLKAGQFLYGLGNYIVVDSQATGLSFTYKAMKDLTAGITWLKVDEGGGLSDEEIVGTDTEDTDLYALNVGFAKDKFSGNVFFATLIDNSSAVGTDDTKSAIGLQGKAALGKINLNCELDYFFGDDGVSGGNDYVGTQLYLDGSMAINNSTKAGLFVIYAMGTDDANETQITEFSNFGDFLPFSYGLYDLGDWSPIEDGGINTNAFELDNNSGSMAISLYGEKTLLEDKLTLRGQFAYLTPTEDANTTLDSLLLFNAGVLYEFAQDTTLMAAVNYDIPSFDDNTSDDAALGLLAGVKLDF